LEGDSDASAFASVAESEEYNSTTESHLRNG
jgi:hypothetical protein